MHAQLFILLLLSAGLLAACEDKEPSDDVSFDPDAINNCAHPSGAILASNIDPAWMLVESMRVPETLDTVDLVVAREDGQVFAFRGGTTGLIEDWGTWPDLEPSTTTLDPILPEHRALRFVGVSAVFDEGTLLVTYEDDVQQNRGGVFVLPPNGAPRRFSARAPSTARRVGDRLFVAAPLFHGRGKDAFVPQVLWSLDLADSSAVPIESVRTEAAFAYGMRLAFLGERAFLSLGSEFVDPNGTTVYTSTHALPASHFHDADAPLTVPRPSAGDFDDEPVVSSFEIDRSVIAMLGSNGSTSQVTHVGAFRIGANGPTTESVLRIDESCMTIRHGFALEGDVVLTLRFDDHRSDPRSRFVRLRHR